METFLFNVEVKAHRHQFQGQRRGTSASDDSRGIFVFSSLSRFAIPLDLFVSLIGSYERLPNISFPQEKPADTGKMDRRWSIRSRRSRSSTNEQYTQATDGVVTGVSAVVGSADSVLSIAGAFVSGTASVAAMFGLFCPLVGEALNLVSEIIKLYRTAEHNKRTCMCLVRRVMAAELAIRPLETLGPNKDFFTKDNYTVFQAFVQTMRNIKTFVEDISQIKGLSKFQRCAQNNSS
jgi:hypothetical protein